MGRYDFNKRNKLIDALPSLPEKQFYSNLDRYVYKFKLTSPNLMEFQLKCEQSGINDSVRGVMRFNKGDLLEFGKWIVENLDD